MVAWVFGLPLLFLRRWPRLSLGYAVFSIAFIVVNLISQALLGECCFTTLARYFWRYDAAPLDPAYNEWFSVRLAYAIFHLTPSHQSVKRATELLILVTTIGVAQRLKRQKAVSAP